MTDHTLVGGLALGVMLGLTPGPVVAEIVRRGATGGIRPAFGVAAGAALGNVATAFLAMAGVGSLLQLPRVGAMLTLAGAAWIAFLGVDSWRQADHVAAGKSDGGAGRRAPALPGWLAGLVLVVANPVVWAFWVAALAAAGGGRHAGILFASGFVAGTVSSDSTLALLAGKGGRLIGPRGQAAALRICGLLLVGFAVLAIVRWAASPGAS